MSDKESTTAEDTTADGDEATDAASESAEVTESEAVEVTGEAPDALPARRNLRVLVASVVVALLMLGGSAGLAAWLYYNEYRPDKETDPAAAQVALEAAKTGTIALLSYSPESLDQDFANAKSKLTGDFLSYYTQFTEQIVAPAAKEKSVKTAASVVGSGVSQISADSAEVLVFINQTTTSKENPDGAFAASSVKVGLTKIDGNWLIASFDPV